MSLFMRQDTAVVNASLDGVDLGPFSKRSGGNVDSEESKFKPGGGLPEQSLGGTRSTENVTLEAGYDLDGVIGREIKWILSRAGSGAVVITQQPTDRDGNIYGVPITWVGTLKSVNLPEFEASGNDAAMIELEVTIAGDPA